MTETAPEKIDLSNCEKEELQFLGEVQNYGCLIATAGDFMVSHVSQSVGDVFGLDPDSIIGERLTTYLPDQTIHDMRSKLQQISSNVPAGRLFGYDVMGDGRLFDVSIHISDQMFVFEFEPKTGLRERDEMALVHPLVARVSRADDVSSACQRAAMALKALSGFDRVMVYKFAEDHSGEVIAEQCSPKMESFLGLKYPASDIPSQARALYVKSPLRLIANVDADVSPIVPKKGVSGAPLDLSLAVTRAVSPIHLEYLRNMGVAASMSVSILRDGALWGLFACHHKAPRYVDYERRTAIELFAQFFAYELNQRVEQESRNEEANARHLHESLMVRLSSGTNLVEGFGLIAGELSELVSCDGVAIFSNGQYVSRGEAPSEREFMGLVRFLNRAPTGTIYATSRLSDVFDDANAYGDRIAGLMAVPISRSPRDYIVFFRREVAREIKWAGNPEKPAELGPNGIRLTPRKSFEAWQETVMDTSHPWTEGERRTAESLRVSLIEVVLKLTDEANEARRLAADKQDLLIAELNHRVRNILNLIQGLVSQGRNSANTISTYTKILDGRIQALARAHDQLTTQEWSPSSLRRLIDVEATAYLNGQHTRVLVAGDAPMLMPEAFSTVALVVHELVTNSAKHGALTDRSGKIQIDLKIEKDGALHIRWREQGGPPVQAPTRRGFGTTIIENSIPYELKGRIETRYLLTGLEVDIEIPARWIADIQEEPAQFQIHDGDTPDDHALSSLGQVLIVEDNMVIALDTASILEDAGVPQVHMSGTVADALTLLADVPISFAILDVNLGNETSLAVAEYLVVQNIPFILATGYGDTASITGAFPSAPILNKPFSSASLFKAIAKAKK